MALGVARIVKKLNMGVEYQETKYPLELSIESNEATYQNQIIMQMQKAINPSCKNLVNTTPYISNFME